MPCRLDMKNVLATMVPSVDKDTHTVLHLTAVYYGEDEKRDRRGNIRFIRRYFPQIDLREIPKMAHAELVIVHPEDFCRYANEFFN